MGKLDLITILIIVANVIWSYKGFKDYSFLEKYKFHVGAIQRGEKIRMFTSGFLHADMQHLLFNMVSLYFFANVVVGYLGTFKFMVIYLGSLYVGSLLSLYFNKNNYNYTAVGASGAVSGIIYSAILLRPEMDLYMYFVPIPIPAYVFGIGYLLYSIYGMKNRIGNIGHDAHFGGAVGGYIITLVLAPYLLGTSLLMVVLLAIPIIILFVMKKTGKL